MVSTPWVFPENIPMSYGPYVSIKQPKVRKSLRKFTTTLDVKPKTVIRRLCAAKSKRKEIRAGSNLWYNIPKRKVRTKVNEQVTSELYHWNTRHPEIVQSPIANDCLKINIDGQTTPQLVPNLLLQLSVRDLHNIMVIPI